MLMNTNKFNLPASDSGTGTVESQLHVMVDSVQLWSIPH